MSLYFLTASKHKFKEIKAVIPNLKQLNIELPELQEIDAKKIITAKLKEALNHHSGQFIVEDTSLYFEALNGLPGPLIKWFLKTLGTEGLFKLTQKLGNNKVTAKTIIGLAKNKKDIHFFTGEVKGQIVSPKGSDMFGWNNIFKPKGSNKTFAQMSVDEKNEISMRGIAAKKLKEFLDSGE